MSNKIDEIMSSKADTICCSKCDGQMVKDKKVEKNMNAGKWCLLVFMVIIGMVLLVFIPIGTVIGAILIIGASKMGHNKIDVWKCQKCGYFFERIK